MAYLLPPYCCKFTELYDRIAKRIRQAGGGITGKGDGKCPDLYRKHKDRQLFWRASRFMD